VKVRPCAEFSSTLPDDTVEDEQDIVQFGGQNVAVAIGEMLARAGYAVDPPAYAGDHGWDFEVRAGRHRFWCQITLIDECLLIFDRTSWTEKVLRRYPASYLDALRQLDRALRADTRFSKVRWHTHDELRSDHPGASSPVD
jgi:hypothetical protein